MGQRWGQYAREQSTGVPKTNNPKRSVEYFRTVIQIVSATRTGFTFLANY